MNTAHYSISILHDVAQFEGLRHEWEQLRKSYRHSHFYHNFSWKWHSWRCIARSTGQQLRIVAGRVGSRLVLVLPLTLQDGVARFLNSGTFEYRDILVDSEHFQHDWYLKTWQAIKNIENLDILLLQNVRLPTAIVDLFRPQGSQLWSSKAESPVVRIDRYESWESYASTRSKKLMADQRRQWRRLKSATEDLQCRQLNDSNEILQTLEWMIQSKEYWSSHTKKVKMVWENEHRTFLFRVVEDAIDSGNLMMMKLSQQGETISAGVGFVERGSFTFELFAYAEAWQNYSPSRLLQEKMISWAIDNGLVEFDFLPGGGSNYKHLWADDYVPSTSYVIAMSAKGTLRIHGQRALSWLQQPEGALLRCYSLLPSSLRSFIFKAVPRTLPAELMRKLEKWDR